MPCIELALVSRVVPAPHTQEGHTEPDTGPQGSFDTVSSRKLDFLLSTGRLPSADKYGVRLKCRLTLQNASTWFLILG